MTKYNGSCTDVSHERLRSVLHYDPDTGVFTNHITRSGRAVKNQVAGSDNGNGYLKINLDSRKYFAHRLAWIYMTGSAPIQIDHINGVRSDNRWENLRAATNEDNCKNQKIRGNNTTGTMGVYRGMRAGSWFARISADERLIHLGTFSDLRDAIKARKDAERKYGYHENHGRSI